MIKLACALALLAAFAAACSESPAAVTPPPASGAAPEAPAQVSNAQPEAALATVTLTAQAEQRLGIEVKTVSRQTVRESRRLAGEIIVPPGTNMTVSAPFGGIVLPAPNRGIPAVGARVARGEILFRIQPLPGEAEALRMRAEATIAQERVQRARERVQAARGALANRSVTQAEADAAERALTEAEADFSGTRSLWSFIESGNPGAIDSRTAIAIAAPRDGMIQNLRVAAGQAVTVGQALYEIVEQTELWVKVPVYTGEIRGIDRTANAQVVPLGQWDAGGGVSVRPVRGPVSGNLGAASVDLFYLLGNANGAFRPEERVAVILPLLRQNNSLTVPASALWRDIHGGAWVYVNTADHVYSRRRVVVSRVVDDVAMLASGPPEGTRIVTVGVAELAGTEFGVGH